jgi:hypothetical protein
MPFFIDSTHAPALLRITLGETWPTVDEQRVWRVKMIDEGLLTAQTRALIDMRPLKQFPHYEEMTMVIASAVRDGGWPLYRAYLAMPGMQFGIARQFQLMAPPTVTLQVFTDEVAAEQWLTGSGR